MNLRYEAACYSRMSENHRENSCNFVFSDRILPADNSGMSHPAVVTDEFTGVPVLMAVLEYSGEENRGENVFAAAVEVREAAHRLDEFIVPEREFLDEILKETASEEKHVDIASFLLSGDYIYAACSGNARAYRLRGNTFQQLTEPDCSIAKGHIRSGDEYLLCSSAAAKCIDNAELDFILRSSDSTSQAVRKLTEASKICDTDNITAILIKF